MRGEQPVLTLMIVDKDNRKNKTIAGSAWKNEYGGYSLKLNPGIVLDWRDEVYLNLNPRMTKSEYGKMMREREEPPTDAGEDDLSFLDNMSEEADGTEEPELAETPGSD